MRWTDRRLPFSKAGLFELKNDKEIPAISRSGPGSIKKATLEAAPDSLNSKKVKGVVDASIANKAIMRKTMLILIWLFLT